MADQLAELMEGVARELLGDPNPRLSSAHELRYGSHGSLSVDLQKGTWFDHETQQGGGVFDLVAREQRIDARESPTWLHDHGFNIDAPHKSNGGQHGPQRRIDKVSNYRDYDGTVLFQVVRYEPKDFRQRRPDAESPDGWNWSTRGVKQVPYMLPEIEAAMASGTRVVIVEGEKCADLLWSLNIPATCNAGGAGKWSDELTRYFKDADVIIIPDFDPQKVNPKTKELMFHDDGRPMLPGQDHALDIARKLHGIAASVQLFDLGKMWPGIKPKDDIFDWFKSGGDIDIFNDLVKQAKPWNAELALEYPKSATIIPFPLRPYLPRPIPVRGWLHAKHYIRQHVVMTVAPGGYGKSSLLICNAIEMVTGKGLIGAQPHEPVNVCYWNAEESDPFEVERRILAFCIAHQIDPDDLCGRLFLGDKIIKDEARLAVTDRHGRFTPNEALIKLITEYVGDNHIACVILDPMIEFHRIPESDTNSMAALIKQVTEPIAAKTNSCFEYSQHTRKSAAGFGGGEITADDSRGAGAAIAAARSVRVINRMTKEEAERAGISDDQRRLYLRVSRDKINMAPPAIARWIHLASVDIGNGPDSQPGDSVQAVTAWKYPKTFDGVAVEDIHFMRAEVSKSVYRYSDKSKAWIGFALLDHFGLDRTNKAARAKIRGVIETWIKNGVFEIETRKDSDSKDREFIIPGKWRDEEAERVQPNLFREE